MSDRFRLTLVPAALGVYIAVLSSLAGLGWQLMVLWSLIACAGWLALTRDARLGPPARPEGVRITRPDGTVIPCELAYQGRDGGVHMWEVMTAFRPGVDQLHIDVMPVRSGIAVPIADHRAEEGSW